MLSTTTHDGNALAPQVVRVLQLGRVDVVVVHPDRDEQHG